MTTIAPEIIADTKYQIMPPMGGWDRKELEKSIARGFHVEHAVVIDENRCILDGFNRWAICQALGIECPTIVKAGLTEDEKLDYIWSVNVPRRHLTPDEKRDLMATRLRMKPEESDRSIAGDLHIDPGAVAEQRAELERLGEIPQTTRAHQRTDQMPHHLVGTDVAQHLDVPIMEVTFRFMAPSTKKPRTRDGMPYDQPQEITPWYSGEIPIPMPIPSSLAEVKPFLAVALAELEREIVMPPDDGGHPFKTMLASVYR